MLRRFFLFLLATSGACAATPSVSIDCTSWVYAGETFPVSIYVSDSDGDLNCYGIRWQGYGFQGFWQPGTGFSASQTIYLTAPSSPGTMNLRGDVADNANNGEVTGWQGVTVYPTNSAPSAWISGTTTVPVFQTGSWTFGADDGDGNLLWWRFYASTNSNPGWSQISGSSVSGSYSTSFSAAGTYAWFVDVEDADGATSYQSFIFTVTKINQGTVAISPSSQTITVGDSITFTASGGNGTSAYIWGSDASGTGTSKAVTFNTAGTRSVTVYRQGDSAYNNSNTATATITVKVNQATVAISPTSQTVTVGQSINFTSSGGNGSGAYTWGGDASGTGSSKSVTFNTAGTRAVTLYRVGDSTYNNSNTATATITVKVNQATVTVSPASQSVSTGQSISFTASGGSGTGAYTWGGDASGTGSTKSVIFNTVGTRTVTVYRAGDSTYNASSSATATIIVGAAPTITQQPEHADIGVGESTTFSVTATGSPAPNYQWRKNGTAISGATGSSLTLTDVLPTDAGTYDVFIYNNYGSVTSTPAPLTTSEPPVVFAASAQYVSSTQVQLSAQAIDSDGNLDKLVFYVSCPPSYSGYTAVAIVTGLTPSSSGNVTVNWNPVANPPMDWITMQPIPMVNGTYQVWVRAFDAVPYQTADSNGGAFAQFTIGSSGGPSATLSPYQIAQGDSVSVAYTQAQSASWIGLFKNTDPDTSPLLQQNVSAGSGSAAFTTNSSFLAGQSYHARLFGSAGTSNKLATSNTLVVVDRWGVAVVDGTGGVSNRPAGTVIDIQANSPPSGEGFIGWTLVEGPGVVGNAGQTATTFTMGNGNSIVRANFTGIPQINSATTANGKLGYGFSYTLTASNAPTNLTASNLPAGLSFQVLQNPTRGVISGTPTVFGTFQMPASASNAGGTGNGLITLTISTTTIDLQFHRP